MSLVFELSAPVNRPPFARWSTLARPSPGQVNVLDVGVPVGSRFVFLNITCRLIAPHSRPLRCSVSIIAVPSIAYRR
jgi:hypothetical protein